MLVKTKRRLNMDWQFEGLDAMAFNVVDLLAMPVAIANARTEKLDLLIRSCSLSWASARLPLPLSHLSSLEVC